MVCILVCGAIINNNKILYIYKRCKNQEIQVSSFSHIRFQHQSSCKCFLRKPFLKATPHNLISHHFQHIYRLVWEGPSCLKHTYTKKHTHIYIYTHDIYDHICIYIHCIYFTQPLGFQFSFPSFHCGISMPHTEVAGPHSS